MQLSFIFYLFSVFLIVSGVPYLLILYKKYIAAGISFLGMTIIAILFGIQIFTVKGDYKKSLNAMGWPPSVNFCPDFLTLTDASGTKVCVDTLGVARTGGKKTLIMYTPGNSLAPSTIPTEAQSFPLHLDLKGDARKNAIILDLKDYKLTWEGVFDGITTSTNTVPTP